MIYLELQCGSKWFVPVSSSIKKRKKKSLLTTCKFEKCPINSVLYFLLGTGARLSILFQFCQGTFFLSTTSPGSSPLARMGIRTRLRLVAIPFNSWTQHICLLFWVSIPIGNKKIGIRARTEVVCCIIFLLRGNRFSEQFSLTLFLDTKMPLGN